MITFKGKATNLNDIKDNMSTLGPKDRALIYAIEWCHQTKSNRDKYTVEQLVGVARTFKEYIL